VLISDGDHPHAIRAAAVQAGTGPVEGAAREQRGSKRKHYEAVQGRSRWEPEMASSVSA